MKKLACLLAATAALATLQAQVPVFENGLFINDGGTPLDVGMYSAPSVYDWNGDGSKDLLVGQLDLGKIRYYQNRGTNNNPSFNGFSFVQAGAVDISLPVG